MDNITIHGSILFALQEDLWTARLGEVEIQIVFYDKKDGNGRLDYFVYGKNVDVPCESSACPDSRQDRYDEDPDGCADACPFKTDEESIDSYKSVWGESIAEIAKVFRGNVLEGLDTVGLHGTEWPSAAKVFAQRDWVLGAMRLMAS